jgi:deoxyribonucleoside regulator
MEPGDKTADAIRVARMYYYHNMTSEAIALELNVSRSTISRLLSYARGSGLVSVHISDPNEHPQQLEHKIAAEFKLKRVHVIPVSEKTTEGERLERVAQYTAYHLNSVFDSNMILGLAWGTTTTAISRHLIPKPTHNAQVVQLNGTGNTRTMGIEYASEIMVRFAQNYQASAHLFPVPTFFDKAFTKKALWEEGSIQRILSLQNQADVLLFSIGAVNTGIPSHVYIGGYLKSADTSGLQQANVCGDIATVFFREDGSFDGIPINERSSGPGLEFFQKRHGICVIAGRAKLRGLHGALLGGLLKELIIDEPSARHFVEEYIPG